MSVEVRKNAGELQTMNRKKLNSARNLAAASEKNQSVRGSVAADNQISRAARVAALREKVRNGDYQLSSCEIARALINRGKQFFN